MKVRMFTFIIVLAALILGPLFPDQSSGETGLLSEEIGNGEDEIVLVRSSGGSLSRPSEPRNQSVGSRLTADEVRQALAAHNKARAEVDSAPLQWSIELARYAQKWADHLASTSRRMEHRPPSGEWKQVYGENLFMGTAGHYGITDAVAIWHQEKSAYRGKAIDVSTIGAYGHYTQVVWKNTKKVGCAKVEAGGNVIMVCNYDPPGNMVGQKPY
jgi:pathogenesis-related protein 1